MCTGEKMRRQRRAAKSRRTSGGRSQQYRRHGAPEPPGYMEKVQPPAEPEQKDHVRPGSERSPESHAIGSEMQPEYQEDFHSEDRKSTRLNSSHVEISY